MTLPTAKMALLHAKARSLAICSHKPQKTATYNGLVSRFAGEYRGHSEKTMCRQRHKSDLRNRETLFFYCRSSLLSPPTNLTRAAPGKGRLLRVDAGGLRITKSNTYNICAF